MKIFIKAHLIYRFFVRHLVLFIQQLKYFTVLKFSAWLHKKNTAHPSSEKAYRQSHKLHTGFTLFELLVVLLLLAILAVITFPKITQQLMRSEKIRVQYTGLGLLQQSKSFALAYRQHILVCGSSSSITCNGEWNKGLLAFYDQNRNAQRDPEEKIIGFEPLALQYGRLRWKGAGGRSYILFQSINGMPIGSNGSLIYCSDDSKYHLQLLISRTGLIRIRDLNQDSILENAQGDAIDCG